MPFVIKFLLNFFVNFFLDVPMFIIVNVSSKLSSAGYNPSGSSFTSANSDKLRSKKKSWINNALNPTYT